MIGFCVSMLYKKGMFKDKKITLMGLGVLGRGVGDAEFFAKEGAELIVTDLKKAVDLKESIIRLKKYKNIRFVFGRHRLEDFENRDFIVKAAGVPLDSPYITHAKKNGVFVYMSTALFVSLISAKTIGVTGTRGKTTVTYMIFFVLRKLYKKGRVFLGGNIQGVSTLTLLPKVRRNDLVVLELDSWQLQGFGDLSIAPDISIFTTFMPDHLNYYKNDLMRYFKDKLNIARVYKKNQKIFAGKQLCSLSKKFTVLLPKETKFISSLDLPKKFTLYIPGNHNLYNAALAYVALKSLSVPKGKILNTLRNFKGVPHRLEKVATINNIEFYNDTTATTPAALEVALESLSHKKIILIMGGSDKAIPFGNLRVSLANTKTIVLLEGSGTERMIREGVLDGFEYTQHSSLSKAFHKALGFADKGDVVLFSPGFASFGMFKNEYDRGDQFKALVKKERH